MTTGEGFYLFLRQFSFGGVFYVKDLLPLDGQVFREKLGQIDWGKTGMGQNLSMLVVAEGVERKSQLQLLQTMDCNEAQGFLFSQPLPSDEYLQVFWDLISRLKNNKLV